MVYTGISAAGWLAYAKGSAALVALIRKIGFDDLAMAKAMASFSIGAVGTYVMLLCVTLLLLGVVFSGQFVGKGTAAGVLLGAFVLLDLGISDRHWVLYWDKDHKYASDPIIDLLKDKPYEHRVALLPFGVKNEQWELFQKVYGIEWTQQIFPNYDIQDLEVIQEPRVPQDKATFLAAIPYPASPANCLRTWELTNTRYLLGLGGGMVDALNREIDPEKRRFRTLASFNLGLKPGSEGHQYEDYAAVPSPTGQLAVVEFTGALPRVSLYSNWQVSPNDEATLKTLASTNFDPAATVLVAKAIPVPGPANGNTNPPAGTVQIQPDYKPKRVEMEADVKTPAVLLYNDKFSPSWHATVDGQPAEILRCNFIARGLYLQPGHHNIVFYYHKPLTVLYISVVAVLIALGLGAWLLLDQPPATEGAVKRSKASGAAAPTR